jgi:glycosyltransferase involved in cell wall biosynthesis
MEDLLTLYTKNFRLKVPLVDEKQLIKELKRELERMVTNPVLVQRIGKNASKHTYKYYSWEAKKNDRNLQLVAEIP